MRRRNRGRTAAGRVKGVLSTEYPTPKTGRRSPTAQPHARRPRPTSRHMVSHRAGGFLSDAADSIEVDRSGRAARPDRKTEGLVMSRYLFVAVALGAVTLMLFPLGNVPAQTILIDDFNDGNDDGWTHYAPDFLAPGIFVVEDGDYSHPECCQGKRNYQKLARVTLGCVRGSEVLQRFRDHESPGPRRRRRGRSWHAHKCWNCLHVLVRGG